MKITAVEAIHLRAEDPLIELFDGSYDDCVLVVHTDAGLTGIGETESMAPAIQAIVRGPSAHNHARSLSAVLIGGIQEGYWHCLHPKSKEPTSPDQGTRSSSPRKQPRR